VIFSGREWYTDEPVKSYIIIILSFTFFKVKVHYVKFNVRSRYDLSGL
jgi:hypothetical protein